MDMTIDEITEKIIIETARIMHDRGAIPAAHDAAWRDRRRYVAGLLKTKEGSEALVAFLKNLDPKEGNESQEDEDEIDEEIQDLEEEIMLEERKFVKRKIDFTRIPADLRKYTWEYLRSIPKLIQYRIDANDYKINEEMLKKIEIEVESMANQEVDRIERFFKKTDEHVAIMNYRIYEETFKKDPAAVAKALRDRLGPAYGDAEISVTENAIAAPTDLREKNLYMDHRIWIKTPILPVIKIEIKKKKEGIW